jgi:predicted dehydrogenase
MSVTVGVIGLGVGERHIHCFESHPDCKVVAICDTDETKLDNVSKKHPETKKYLDPDKLLEDPDIDLVSIASYDNVHFDQACKAIEHGKHVFVEKPICLFKEEAKKLRNLLCSNLKIQFSSNHILRLSSRFQELKSKIDNGELGKIYYVEADYQYGRIEKIVGGWRGKIPFYSVVYGGGVHVIDLLQWMTGDEIVEVSAYGNQLASGGTQFKFNDFVIATLKWKSGMIGKITANFGCQRPHFHAVEIHGTGKVFINREGSAELWENTGKGIPPTPVDTPYRDYQKPDLIWSFIDQILGKGKALIQADEVFRLMSVCFAIEESVSVGHPILVDYS